MSDSWAAAEWESATFGEHEDEVEVKEEAEEEEFVEVERKRKSTPIFIFSDASKWKIPKYEVAVYNFHQLQETIKANQWPFWHGFKIHREYYEGNPS
jgi:hypothetical protein